MLLQIIKSLLATFTVASWLALGTLIILRELIDNGFATATGCIIQTLVIDVGRVIAVEHADLAFDGVVHAGLDTFRVWELVVVVGAVEKDVGLVFGLLVRLHDRGCWGFEDIR